MEGWEGWISGPEAEREYAVEPVGVERIRPSAWVLGLSSIQRVSWERVRGMNMVLFVVRKGSGRGYNSLSQINAID